MEVLVALTACVYGCVANQRQSEEVYHVAEQQSRLISELSQFNKGPAGCQSDSAGSALQDDLVHAQATIREMEKVFVHTYLSCSHS